MFWQTLLSPQNTASKYEENFTRYVHRFFAKVLVLVALFCGILQYFGHPISCWSPAHFTSSAVSYANNKCYFVDKYYTVPEETPIPEPQPGVAHDNYYKWTPYVLLFLAAVYLIPEIAGNFWRKILVVNVDSIIALSRQSINAPHDSAEAAIEQLATEVQGHLNLNDIQSRGMGFRRWLAKVTPSTEFVVKLQHLGIKVGFAVGAVLPLALLSKIFSFEFYYQTVNSNNVDNNVTLFPKVILCDFKIRHLQNIQLYTLQCNIPANEMFEKISILVCFLAVVVSTSSLGDVISYMTTCLFKPGDYSYVKKHMELIVDLQNGYDTEVCKNFVDDYLKCDGVYFIQLIAKNSSNHVVCRVLATLFERYTMLLNDKPLLAPPYAQIDRFQNDTSSHHGNRYVTLPK